MECADAEWADRQPPGRSPPRMLARAPKAALPRRAAGPGAEAHDRRPSVAARTRARSPRTHRPTGCRRRRVRPASVRRAPAGPSEPRRRASADRPVARRLRPRAARPRARAVSAPTRRAAPRRAPPRRDRRARRAPARARPRRAARSALAALARGPPRPRPATASTCRSRPRPRARARSAPRPHRRGTRATRRARPPCRRSPLPPRAHPDSARQGEFDRRQLRCRGVPARCASGCRASRRRARDGSRPCARRGRAPRRPRGSSGPSATSAATRCSAGVSPSVRVRPPMLPSSARALSAHASRADRLEARQRRLDRLARRPLLPGASPGGAQQQERPRPAERIADLLVQLDCLLEQRDRPSARHRR